MLDILIESFFCLLSGYALRISSRTLTCTSIAFTGSSIALLSSVSSGKTMYISRLNYLRYIIHHRSHRRHSRILPLPEGMRGPCYFCVHSCISGREGTARPRNRSGAPGYPEGWAPRRRS